MKGITKVYSNGTVANQDVNFNVKKGEIHRVTFKNEQLYSFFPKTDSAETMKRKIIEILKLWRADRIND